MLGAMAKQNTNGKPQNPFNRWGAGFLTLGIVGLLYNGFSAFRAENGRNFLDYFFSTNISFGRSGSAMPEFLAQVLVFGPFVAIGLAAVLFLLGLTRRTATQQKVAAWEAEQRAAAQQQWDAEQAQQQGVAPAQGSAPQGAAQPQNAQYGNAQYGAAPQSPQYGAAPQQPHAPTPPQHPQV